MPIEGHNAEHEQITRSLGQLLDEYRSASDSSEERGAQAKILYELGLLHHAVPESAKAHTYLEEGLDTVSTLGDKSSMADVFSEIGTVHAEHGNHAKARHNYHRPQITKELALS